MSLNNAELIFQQWEAALKNKDRSKHAMPNNFDELFSALKASGVNATDAHPFLDRAARAHFPNKTVLKNTWKKSVCLHNVFANENEFLAEWKESIKTCAANSYFEHYPIKIQDEDDDGEPKVYGNMSVKEYKLQRKYADSFPTLNTDELVRQMKERQNLSGDLKDVLGGKDDK